ncbi:hypothetical protein [Nocardiopsis sp. JB363]|uniref:hypothetical protein n=1 Tax=Nocardiopsis sp. JB363 TaxID=1434837 RepID=UPI00097A14B7|nr:hypothetical protein [Nocardiopsis sp. JB363]SIO87641.1 hypothetical protein BQ8420_17070 [Nocardiopsis sp. JB363]
MNFTHKLWAKINTMVLPRDPEAKDKGAGFVEYGAIIVFVALVAALFYNSSIGTNIVQGISNAISQVFLPSGG